MTSRAAIHLVVRNGAPWLVRVLDSIAAQTHRPLEVTVWDNASTDATPTIVSRYDGFRLVRSPQNIGVWAAQERMLADSTAEFVCALTDVVLDASYVAACVRVMDDDPRVGAVQGKLLRGRDPSRIDSLGFRLEPSRRLTILGHGEADGAAWSRRTDIFGVEGAAPVFRRSALEDCRIEGNVIDPDYRVGPLGYGDDFDLAWRLTLMGWRQVMEPAALGWHDRATTVDVGRGTGDHVRRRIMRAAIPALTRQLDWANVRFSIMKNDHILNILHDIPAIVVREAAVAGYCALFEPRTLAGVVRFARLAPAMLRRRRLVMRRARLDGPAMRKFIR